MNDIQAHQSSVDTLNRAGHQLIEADRHSEDASVTQTKLADLNRRWKALQDKASQRQQQLEAALREVSHLHHSPGQHLRCVAGVSAVAAAMLLPQKQLLIVSQSSTHRSNIAFLAFQHF